jgi:hypothetical protein
LPLLVPRGFEPSDTLLDFTRPRSAGSHIVRFGGRLDERQHCQVSGTVGVLFDDVERILKGPANDASPRTPTIVMPLHLLHADRQYFEWTLAHPTGAPAVAVAILAELTSYAMPFFERYKRLEDVRQALESANPADWFILNPEQRIMTLAAVEHASGSPERAVHLLDVALAERDNALPKKRYLLEKLRTRLATAS